MSGLPKLTPEEIGEIVALRERGRGYRQIGERFGVSEGAILYQCLKHGAVSPRQRKRAVPVATEARVCSDGRTMRKFTQAEDAQLLALEAEGLSYPAIARRMNRARTSVRIRLMMLAQREELPLAEATACSNNTRP